VDTKYLECILGALPQARGDEDGPKFSAAGRSATGRGHDEGPAALFSPPNQYNQTAAPLRAATLRSSAKLQERTVSVPESRVERFEMEYEPPTHLCPIRLLCMSSSHPLFIV
jgi:hypothetical protein